MEERRHAVDVRIPAALTDQLLDLLAQRAADDQRNLHKSLSSGNWSTEMKDSLKSARAESSMYSTWSGSSNATWRSRKERSVILAPSPAVFPTDRIRSTSTGGTRPMTFALSGFRYEPNDPPSNTSSRSAVLMPITSINTLIPVAIDPFANCSSRTSRWLR